MLLSIFLFIELLAFGISVLSFFMGAENERLLLPFFAAVLLLFAGMSAYNIEQPTCAVTNDYLNATGAPAWSCHTNVNIESTIGLLNFLFGAVMFVYAIYLVVRGSNPFQTEE